MTRPIDSRLAVCSWSLRPDSPADLARKVLDAGLAAVQLHLDPLREHAWDLHDTQRTLRDAAIRTFSGMMAMHGEDYATLDSIAATGGVRPDATWDLNLRAAHANAELAAALSLPLVTFHAGFVPHDPAHPERATIVRRTRAIADAFLARGVRVALETGQESADNLLSFLDQVNAGLPTHLHVGVNFDPANMILYGTGHPIHALRLLLPRVLQVHVKDARPAPRPGVWGEEVPAGAGHVDWPAFFTTLASAPGPVNFVVEREAGEQRVHDARAAADLVRRLAREAAA